MISDVLWHSSDSNFAENASDIFLWNEFEIDLFETVVKSPRGQWVKQTATWAQQADHSVHFVSIMNETDTVIMRQNQIQPNPRVI